MTTRINARIDGALTSAVDTIRRRTGMTLTQVVEEALLAWTQREARSRPDPARAFEATGFIGSGRGPRDLARNFKRAYGRSLRKKT